MGNLADLIAKYGFPIVAAGGMGYMIYYVWTWATREIKPVLNDANVVLIALIDRIRMLDNDLIRLNQKVNIVLMLREMNHDELLEKASKFRKEEAKDTVVKTVKEETNSKLQAD
jgi:hypothetical protein